MTPDESVTLTCGIKVKLEQAEVIRHLERHGVTVVSAGAGVGKTYTFVAAVLELLATGRAQADEFVLITFTNQAADEIRRRLNATLGERVRTAAGDEAARHFWTGQRERLALAFIGTIHGFCSQILSLHGYALGVAREASVTFAVEAERRATVDAVTAYLSATAEGDPLARMVRDGSWAEYDLRRRLQKIFRRARGLGLDAARLRDATARQEEDGPDDPAKAWRLRIASLIADIEARYVAGCREQQRYDAAALLLHTADMLEAPGGDAVVAQIRRRFSWLFVDEFQDTSATQERIVSALSARLGVLVVGDRKQSIYDFAGADVSLMDAFAARCGTAPLALRTSGRPSLPLLNAQNALFGRMRRRFGQLDEPLAPSGRNLVPGDRLPPMVVLSAEEGEDNPIKLGAERIQRLVGMPLDRPERPLVAHGDIAVLVRTNEEVDAWMRVLRGLGLPCASDRGTPFLRRPEVVAAYRVLQLVLRYPDDVALVEALATPCFAEVDLGGRISDILAYGSRPGTELCDDYQARYPEHAARLIKLRRASRSATVPQLLARLDTAFGLKAAYRARGDEGAAIGLDRLRDYARDRFQTDQALTLRTFLDVLRRDMLSDPDLPEPDAGAEDRRDVVRVMTIHRSKGLEFPIVVIPNLAANRRTHRPPEFLLHADHGLEVNLQDVDVDCASRAFLRQAAAAGARRLAEEMRLFYVAVTRAERMVVMIGQKPMEPPPANGRGNHGWQHELVAAEDVLRRYGVLFGRL